ncbi:hypothetical protein MVEN_01701800 [Mycena venus]|uniref:Uncharacterized protein n=1 Tax=Mycena venus TaxID=2733690 RepID=A0A8H6XPR0_9AGAR|nr:hypothetical protein MVEN_01701800 [Mycena venus]
MEGTVVRWKSLETSKDILVRPVSEMPDGLVAIDALSAFGEGRTRLAWVCSKDLWSSTTIVTSFQQRTKSSSSALSFVSRHLERFQSCLSFLGTRNQILFTNAAPPKPHMSMFFRDPILEATVSCWALRLSHSHRRFPVNVTYLGPVRTEDGLDEKVPDEMDVKEDPELQSSPSSKSSANVDEFPDGGFRSWAVVLGAFWMFFATFDRISFLRPVLLTSGFQFRVSHILGGFPSILSASQITAFLSISDGGTFLALRFPIAYEYLRAWIGSVARCMVFLPGVLSSP